MKFISNDLLLVEKIMSLADFGAIKIVLRDLLLKNANNELSIGEIDYQFSFLLENISKYFFERKYFFLFDWITETIKREDELRIKSDEIHPYFQKEKKAILDQLIQKVHLVHSKIIELVVDEIYLSYMDYIDLKRIDELDLAIQSKISTLGLANSFLLYLTENRSLNEKVYDSYIELISQSLEIFT